MLKIVSENFIHALLLFLGLFLKISRWVPLSSVDKLLLAGESFKDFLRNDYCLPYFLLFRRKVALFARN